MSENKSEFYIPFEESRRGEDRSPEQKALARRLGAYSLDRIIDRPRIGGGRDRRNRIDIDIPTGGVPGYRDPTGTDKDIDLDGWVDEGTKRPRWIGLPSADEKKKKRTSGLSSGGKEVKKIQIERQQTLEDYQNRVEGAQKRIDAIKNALDEYKKTGAWNAEKHNVIVSLPGGNKESSGRISESIDDPEIKPRNFSADEIAQKLKDQDRSSDEFIQQIEEKLKIAKLELELHETLLKRKKERMSQGVIDLEDLSDEQIEQLSVESRMILGHPHGARLFSSESNDRAFVAHKGPSVLDGGVLDPGKSQGQVGPDAPISGNTRQLNEMVASSNSRNAQRSRATVNSMDALANKIRSAIENGQDFLEYEQSMDPAIYMYGFTPGPIVGVRKKFNPGEKIPIDKMRELLNDIENNVEVERGKLQQLERSSSALEKFGGQHLSAHRSMLEAFNIGYFGRYWFTEIPENVATINPEWKKESLGFRGDIKNPFMYGRWQKFTRAGIWLIDGEMDSEIADLGITDEIQIVGKVKPIFGFSTPWDGGSVAGRTSLLEDIGPALFARAIKMQKRDGKIDKSNLFDESLKPNLPQRESLSSGGTGDPKKPKYPRKPAYGPILGGMNDIFDGVKTWEEFKKRYDDQEIVFLDYETTGLKFDEWNVSNGNGNVTQIGAVKVKNGQVIGRFETYVNPGIPMSEWEEWSRLNLKNYDGNPVTDKFFEDKPSIAKAHQMLVEFAGPNALMGVQNAAFDKDVLEDALKEHKIDWSPRGWIDLKDIAAMTLPRWSEDNPDGPFRFDREEGKNVPSNGLKDITRYLGVDLGDKHHNADADAEATAESLKRVIDGAIKNGWSRDVLDPANRQNYVDRSRNTFAKKVTEFNEEKAEYLRNLANLDTSNNRMLSSGGDKKRTRPQIQLTQNLESRKKLQRHRARDYSYGEKSELGGEVRRSSGNWLRGMTNSQMAKLLVPESNDQYFEMWLDDFAPTARGDERITNAFRKYYDEFLELNPWDQSDFAPENIEAARKLVKDALDANPRMRLMWEKHGGPMVGVFSSDAIAKYESIPSVAQKMEKLQSIRNTGRRPYVAARLSPRIDMLSFNRRALIERDAVETEGVLRPWLFGTGDVSRTGHHVDISLSGTLLHEWGHWLHFRALRDYENAGKPINRTNYYGSGDPNDPYYINALAIAAEYNDTAMNKPMMQSWVDGDDINSREDIPRTLTSYGNTNMAEAMAEGIVAYLHPNRTLKDRLLNKKLKRDVETLLGLDEDQDILLDARPLSSGVTQESRDGLQSRISQAKKDVQRPRLVKLSTFDEDGIELEKAPTGAPEFQYLMDLYQQTAAATTQKERMRKKLSGTIDGLNYGSLGIKGTSSKIFGSPSYSTMGVEKVVKSDIMERIAESVDFTPEEFISAFDDKVDEDSRFASFRTAENFGLVKAIIDMAPDKNGRKLFGFKVDEGKLRTFDITEAVMASRSRAESAANRLREKNFLEIQQMVRALTLRGTNPFGATVNWNLENQKERDIIDIFGAFTDASSDVAGFNPDGALRRDHYEDFKVGMRIAMIMDEAQYELKRLNDFWVNEVADRRSGVKNGPPTKLLVLRKKSNDPNIPGHIHDEFFIKTNFSGKQSSNNIDPSPWTIIDPTEELWWKNRHVQYSMNRRYGSFSPDDWEAEYITMENWETGTDNAIRDFAIRKFADEFGEGPTTKFYGSLILDANTEEGKKYLKQAIVRDLIHTWAISSNNRNAVALTIQSMIRKEFGLNMATGWDKGEQKSRMPGDLGNGVFDPSFDSGLKLDEQSENILRSVIRAQYDATQDFFKRRGITHLRVFRGTGKLDDDEINQKFADLLSNGVTEPVVRDSAVMRPASSWSVSDLVAGAFVPGSVYTSEDSPNYVKDLKEDPDGGDGFLVTSYVPIENVLSTPFTGFGCLGEQEVVVLGKPMDVYVVKPKHAKAFKKMMTLNAKDFFANKDFNVSNDQQNAMDAAREVASLSSGARRVYIEQAELIKRSISANAEYDVDEERAEMLRKTLTKGFVGGFTVEPDQADVKTGIAVARNKHGMKFNLKDDFDADGNPSERLVDTFMNWITFHGPATFNNPKPDAREVTIGGWKAGNLMYLDIVDVYPNTPEMKERARKLGSEEKQIAITDLDLLWKLLDSGEDVSPAFIPTGGNGGQTIGIQTINKFGKIMSDMRSNRSQTGSMLLSRVGPLTKFNSNSRSSGARRVRFTDHSMGGREIDYLLTVTPSDSGNFSTLRAYEFDSINIARESLAKASGVDKSEIRLSRVVDEVLSGRARGFGDLPIKPIALITAGSRKNDPLTFDINKTEISQSHMNRGLTSALLKIHSDIHPDISIAKDGKEVSLSSGSRKLKAVSRFDDRVSFITSANSDKWYVRYPDEARMFRSYLDSPENANILVDPRDKGKLKPDQVAGRMAFMTERFVEYREPSGKKRLYAIVHSSPNEFYVFDVGQLQSDSGGRFSDWARTIRTYTEKDSPNYKKFKGRGLVGKMTVSYGTPEGKWTVSEIMVKDKHSRRGLGKEMVSFHREIYPELELGFRFKTIKEKNAARRRSLRRDPVDPDFLGFEVDKSWASEESVALSSGAASGSDKLSIIDLEDQKIVDFYSMFADGSMPDPVDEANMPKLSNEWKDLSYSEKFERYKANRRRFVEFEMQDGTKKMYLLNNSSDAGVVYAYDVDKLKKILSEYGTPKPGTSKLDDPLYRDGPDTQGALVGTLHASRTLNKKKREQRKSWEIYGIEVNKSHQRRGIGSAMLKFHRDTFPELRLGHSDALSESGRAFADATPVQNLSSGRFGETDALRREIGRLLAAKDTNNISAALLSIANDYINYRYEMDQGMAESLRNRLRKLPDYDPNREYLFSGATVPDYRIIHTAPNSDTGASLDDLTRVYPQDIYSQDATRLYGTGQQSLDRRAAALINEMRGQPNKKVRIYRAVPISDEKRIGELEKQKAYILRTGKVPPYVDTDLDHSEYYDKISTELNSLLDSPIKKQPNSINDGDWVTPFKEYAFEHGDSHMGGRGKYEIISQRVLASEIFTNGDSWMEWGYEPKNKPQKSPSLSSGWNTNLDDLDDDLADYYDAGEYSGIPMLKHPLVFWMGPVNVDMINEMYRQKSKAVDEASQNREWNRFIFMHERPYRIAAFTQIAEELTPEEYWPLLGDIWTDTENQWQYIDELKDLLTYDLPSRDLIMEEDERASLAAMPDEIKIYRGYQVGKNESGLSWTTDRSRAQWFAGRLALDDDEPAVMEAVVNKKDVIAFFSRRGENEIVLSRPPTIKTENSDVVSLSSGATYDRMVRKHKRAGSDKSSKIRNLSKLVKSKELADVDVYEAGKDEFWGTDLEIIKDSPARRAIKQSIGESVSEIFSGEIELDKDVIVTAKNGEKINLGRRINIVTRSEKITSSIPDEDDVVQYEKETGIKSNPKKPVISIDIRIKIESADRAASEKLAAAGLPDSGNKNNSADPFSDGITFEDLTFDSATDGGIVLGTAYRTLNYSDGKPYIVHDSIRIGSSARGSGIASEINARNENIYKKLGVNSILMMGQSSKATDQLGATHWARNGFEFAGEPSRQRFIRIIDEAINNKPEIFSAEELRYLSSLYKKKVSKDGGSPIFKSNASAEQLVNFAAADELFANYDGPDKDIFYKRKV